MVGAITKCVSKGGDAETAAKVVFSAGVGYGQWQMVYVMPVNNGAFYEERFDGFIHYGRGGSRRRFRGYQREPRPPASPAGAGRAEAATDSAIARPARTRGPNHAP